MPKGFEAQKGGPAYVPSTVSSSVPLGRPTERLRGRLGVGDDAGTGLFRLREPCTGLFCARLIEDQLHERARVEIEDHEASWSASGRYGPRSSRTRSDTGRPGLGWNPSGSLGVSPLHSTSPLAAMRRSVARTGSGGPGACDTSAHGRKGRGRMERGDAETAGWVPPQPRTTRVGPGPGGPRAIPARSGP